MLSARVEVADPGLVPANKLNYMVKHQLTRYLEQTGKWVPCQSSYCDRYLVESEIYRFPPRGSQNVLKIELGVKESELNQIHLQYELHVTIRLVKMIYLDPTSVQTIGEQTIYKLPTFEQYVLAELYQ